MQYLTDENGKIDSSVVFHGKMEDVREKENLIKNASVGVLNLTGESECCPMSGVEMQAQGVPLVTTVKLGCRDVVRNKVSGYTVKTESEAVDRIVQLLTDNNLNNKFSINAIAFIRERFDSETSFNQWAQMLKKVVEGTDKTDSQDIGIKYCIYSNVYRVFKRIIRGVKIDG